MSLRDELDPPTIYRPAKTDVWLANQPAEFQTEFNDLVHDHTIESARLWRLARNYQCDVAATTFTDWRKQQWASKTN